MKLHVAQLQTRVWPDQQRNLQRAAALIEQAARQGADFVTLPEMFCCPYQTECFPAYAEPEGGEVWQACSRMARAYRVWLSAGSMPELDGDGNIYNTAYVFDRQGSQVAKHRKMHLFDISIRGGQQFQESATLSAGTAPTVFETEFGTMGLCVCYDLRFPELSRLMALSGARVILVPAAFNLTTGPIHWELLFRARALDNQAFVLGTAPARDEQAGYVSWGHTIAAGPWGNVLGQLEEKPGMLMTELDLDETDAVREQLPLLRHRRTDVYSLELKTREEESSPS